MHNDEKVKYAEKIHAKKKKESNKMKYSIKSN